MRRAPITNQVTNPVNVAYLVVGLVFLAISGSWALRTAGVVNPRQFGWVLPLMLVAIGAVGLLASTAKGIRRREPDDPPMADSAHGAGGADVADPIPTYSFGVDTMEQKLERAASERRDTRSDERSDDQPDELPDDQQPGR
jgi:hypothetical protein